MHADTRSSDILAFVALSIALSLAIGVMAWMIRLPSGYYLMRNGMLLVPALSVMLAARGFPWRRKCMFAAGVLGVFLAIELVAYGLGVQAVTANATSFGASLGVTLLTLGYHTFLLVYPLAALVIFVGNDPRALWTPREQGRQTARKRRR